MSVRFEDALDLRYQDGRQHWMVLRDFHYDTNIPCAGLYFHPCFGQGDYRIDVPAGFETDFASVPQILWGIIPPTGSYGKAAVIHDYLYRTRGLATRKQADAVLLEAMTFLQVDWLTRQALYWGVRVGGWSSYRGGL